ncbi:NAD(P)-dependent oxidoreductase [Streptomyces clavuligerus]|uniref:NAD-dependent epimerase/dehydratase n=1 Tax=Streptomyces clavuligerus TaxID=1901 RepID=B5GLZ2_STRCL|nr:NAD(P)H-binding protein [Streptomyces clavuligerus]EDY47338.1 NAD-dependent epimerase/dehydratase [Streptomyces clavuligerus]EFG04996.1 NAD-dependent epimerase/dehydratase [Streptomyces clavuligerus]MBY6306582.1 NAD(P)H-binding protein [Streptomyces clavuligerus]QCS10811.1 3-beta hydroxysteroid dehydrogenase [Streptomyces clavuligerus]QPJ97152.1 NAD(P)H-binding protein [Streptomyces clavuligerus]
MAKIALFGANGTIGSRVLREALDRGHHVTAAVRNPSKITEQHPNLTVTTGDVLDPASVTAVAEGQDVVVSAVGGGDGPGHIATIAPAAKSLVAGVRPLGGSAPRLIAVGGAGSLRTPDGKQVWDAEGLPEFLLQIMHAHGDALDFYRSVDDVRWTCLSPAGQIAPGERTGTYRTALDDLVTDADGISRISAEDYAVALVDEIEKANHIGERFTVGA